MKSYRIIFAAALVLALASCSKEQTPAEKYYIGAEIAEVGSKTTRDDLSILWSEGDAIRIGSNNNFTGGVFTLEDGKDTKKGLFSGSTELSGDYYMALYPSTGSFDPTYYYYYVPTTITYGQEFKDFPMAAYESSTKTLNFKPMAAVVQLNLYDAVADRNITAISIRTNGYRGFGKVYVPQSQFVSGKISAYLDNVGPYTALIELPEGGVKIGNSAETATAFYFLIKPNGNQGSSTMAWGDYYNMITITVSSGTDVMHLYKTNPEFFSAGEIRRFSPVQFKANEEKAVSVSIDGGAYVTLAKAISDAVYPNLSLKLKSNFPGNLVSKEDMSQVYTFINNCSQPINLDLSEVSMSNNRGDFERGKHKIKEFICPNTLVTLEQNSFRDWIDLEQVTLNEGLTQIGIDCFVNTPNMGPVNIPSTVVNIQPGLRTGTGFTVTEGNNTFFAENGVLYKWLNTQHTQKQMYIYPMNNTRTSFTVPFATTYYQHLFDGASFLQEIIFPYREGKYNLGGVDFTNLPNLHTLKFYADVTTNTAKDVGTDVPAGQAKMIFVPTDLVSTFESKDWIQTLVNTYGFTLTGGADSYPESKSSIIGLGEVSTPSNEWK